MLLDNRKLYVCEWNTNFEVLNGDDFDLMDMGGFGGQIGSYGKGMRNWDNEDKDSVYSVDECRNIFLRDVKSCFGISDKQIIWLKPSKIPRVEGKCCECKNLKSFQKWECEHYGERKVCHRCLLEKYSNGFFKEHFSEGHQKDFLEEMAREEKGRTLI